MVKNKKNRVGRPHNKLKIDRTWWNTQSTDGPHAIEALLIRTPSGELVVSEAHIVVDESTMKKQKLNARLFGSALRRSRIVTL